MSVSEGEAAARPGSSNQSAAKAWSHALKLTAPIANTPHRILATVIEEVAERFGDAPALLSDRECLTYRALAERSNQYARWALDQSLAKGDAVCLLMPNRPEYMAIWLGITRVGGVVSLLNTNLAGPSLAHCIRLVGPKPIIVAGELIDPLTRALQAPAGAAQVWAHGAGPGEFPRLDRDIERHAGEKLSAAERRALTIQDRALYVYTSGTTGLPKAANVSHYRLMQWSHWFAGMMDTRPGDRMYNCLPMYHSVGGVLATGALLVGGGSVVIREKFSARQFWNDVIRWDCTLFQYIGELCRYLLHSEPSPRETEHRIRMCCGNGLRPDVWTDFQTRFCIPCAPNEVGEAIGQVLKDPSSFGSRFEGYTSREASEKKILRDVFEPGDAWFRTGDLMRRDEKGYFYFVDRIGDTFRWKGENVSTTEVTETIAAYPGVIDAVVYGVTIPGTEGRAGMAAVVVGPSFDLTAFRHHLERLPEYARPLFLRLRCEIELTATFKPKKQDLSREGYHASATGDAIYLNDPQRQAFVRVDEELYDRIRTGRVRL